MKKLYLLPAAAMMAFAANAQDFQGLIPDGADVVAEVVDGALLITPPASAANQWDAQVITPSFTGLDGQAEGAEFTLSFDFKGSADGGNFRIASGKTYPWNPDYNQGANTQIVNDLGTPEVYGPNTTVSTDWQSYEYDYYLGAEGGDSVRLEIDCGAAGGPISFKNFELKIDGKTVWTAFGAAAPVTPPATPSGDSDLAFIPDGNGVSGEDVKDGNATVLKLVVPAEAKEQWDAQLITPSFTGLAGQAEGASFCFSFDFKGSADGGNFRIASGKTYPWNPDYNQGANTQIVDDLGSPLVYGPNTTVSSDWQHYDYDFYLGAEGGDSVRLEIDCGQAGGDIMFKNFELKIDGKSVFTKYSENGTAIAEIASVKAFVANNVLYASEASNVVVYNINGVAVISANNVNSLDLSSLKAGLYIAKVNGAAVKFVK